MGTLKMPINGQLVEGHPVGIEKIILGDLRERTWEADGQTYTQKYDDGEVLFDRTEPKHRPWFVLVYESGKRVVD